ncbi:hypothetical protein [Epilithonimonas sp. UC225_85]|uniref:hypothetical protein n=1 Tax=Epilithonimonas sp. UC225_85 TaxID=3350167 RepID=UPI0036D31864
MKKYLYLLVISFSLISCYTYRSNAEKDVASKNTAEAPVKSNVPAAQSISNPQVDLTATESKSPRKPKNEVKNPAPKSTNIQEMLEANKYFKIDVADKSYKIQVVKWDSDTLVAHVIHKPKKILKFHKNQINQSTIAERRFSQPTADIITVVAYAAIGVGIWALVK